MSFPDIDKEIPQRVHRKNDCNKPLPWQIAKRCEKKRKVPQAHRTRTTRGGVNLPRKILFRGTLDEADLEVIETMFKIEGSEPREYSSHRLCYQVVDSEGGQAAVSTWDILEAHRWAVALGDQFERMFFVEPVG